VLGLGQDDPSLMCCTFHYLHATHKLVDVDTEGGEYFVKIPSLYHRGVDNSENAKNDA